MVHDEEALQKILEANPFTDVLSDWDRQLAQFNDGQIDKNQLQFLLDGDNEWVMSCQKKYEDANLQFHFELIPDVFRGDPSAPVWILLLNPGFSAIDLYDHLGLCPFCEKRLIAVRDSAGKHACAPACLKLGISNSVNALHFRQKTMLEQLKLAMNEATGGYGWFDNRFRTVESEDREKVGKGGYWWWKEFLFGVDRSRATYLFRECNIRPDAKEIGQKFFAIDAFPYHSKNFSCGIFRQREYKESQYFKFWKKLVEWALCSGRKLIVRYKSVLEVLEKNIDKQIWAKCRDNVYRMPSQTPSLTTGNITTLERNDAANRQKAIDGLRSAWQDAEQ